MATPYINKPLYDALLEIIRLLGGGAVIPPEQSQDLLQAILDMQTQLGATNEAQAANPSAVSGINGLLRLIADRAGTVINNTGSINLEVDQVEELLTDILAELRAASPLQTYEPSDIDTATDTQYFGFLHETGKYYILKKTATDVRYTNGANNYPTAWTGRAGLSYNYYNLLTW